MWVRARYARCCGMSLRFLTGLTGPGLKVFVRVAHTPPADKPLRGRQPTFALPLEP